MKNERKKTKKTTKRPSVLNNAKNKKLDKNKKNIVQREKRKLPIDFPEAIAGTIINKIISYVIRETTVKEIYSHMDKKCFSYVKYLINPYLSTEYINYENGLDNIELQKNKINYKTHVTEKINTWAYLPEPCTPGNDRFSSGLTKLISLKNEQIENDEKYKDIKEALKRQSSFNRNIILSESIEFENEIKKSKKNLLRIKKSKKRKSILEEMEDKEKEKELEKERIKEERRKEKERKEIEEKVLKELPYEDLPKEKYENKYMIVNDNEENNELRKEREHLIKKKLELKMIQDMQDKKDKLIKFHNRLQRNFDGSKQTFDPEGNILLIRSPKVDNFISEFKFAKIPSIQNEQQKRNTITTNKTAKTKSQILRPSKNVTKSINTSNTNNLKESKNDWDKPATPPEFKLIFDYIKDVLIPKWLNKPYMMNKTKSKNDSKDTEKKKYNVPIKSFKQFFGPFLNKYVYKVNVIRNPYDIMRNNQIFVRNPNSKNKRSTPSGSNFNLISPETGVVIESQINKKKEIKDGGFEYIKKYNKPSMYEFSKLVMETSNLNSLNSRALSSGLIESKINELNEIKKVNKFNEINKDDYNGYILEFSDNMNPLFQNALSISDKDKNGGVGENQNENTDNKENEKYKSKDKNIFRAMEEGYLKSRYNSMNPISLPDSIKLSSDINNLYSYFEDKDNTNNISENIDNNKSLKNYSSIRNIKRNKDNNNNNNVIIYQPPLPVIKAHRVNTNKSEIREMKNKIKGRKILNKFNYSIIKDQNWGEEDEKKINEKLRLEQLNSLKNKNDDNLLKKVGENIIKNNNNHKINKKLIKSASAGNIF